MPVQTVQVSAPLLYFPEGQEQLDESELIPVPGHCVKVPPAQAVMRQLEQPKLEVSELLQEPDRYLSGPHDVVQAAQEVAELLYSLLWQVQEETSLSMSVPGHWTKVPPLHDLMEQMEQA